MEYQIMLSRYKSPVKLDTNKELIIEDYTSTPEQSDGVEFGITGLQSSKYGRDKVEQSPVKLELKI